MDSLGLFQVKC